MRIGFISWGLFSGKGGAERLCVSIVHFLVQRGHECVIFYQGGTLDGPAYPLPPGVPTHDLALRDAASLSLARKALGEASPDIVCAMCSGSSGRWLPALFHNTGIPLLISEHNSPHAIEKFSWPREERLACMAVADSIHLLSRSYLTSLPEFLHNRALAIPNPAPAPIPANRSKEDLSRKTLLSVARLEEHQKQLSFLIRAFASLADDFPDWDCRICGGGLSHSVYTDMCKRLGLEGRIMLTGPVDNVDVYYSSSHLFCLSSLYEGCPIALLEAQSHGLPSVGFAACPGVNEAIVHGENGLLVSEMTAESLAASLRPLMQNPALRRSMGDKAQKLLDRYEGKHIFGLWENLLLEVAKAKNNTRLDSLDIPEDPALLAALRHMLRRPAPVRRAEPGGSKNSLLARLRANAALRVNMPRGREAEHETIVS